MSSYILRNIPIELWSTVKARAASEGAPLRQVILQLLRAYAEGRISLSARQSESAGGHGGA